MFVVSSRYATEQELYRDPFLKVTERAILSATLQVFDLVRELHGSPIAINSGRRSAGHQEELRQQGYRTATTSPHVYGTALDVDVPDGKTDEYLVALVFGAAKLLELSPPRVGWRAYRDGKVSSSFVHYDFTFLLPRELIDSLPVKARVAWRKPGLTW